MREKVDQLIAPLLAGREHIGITVGIRTEKRSEVYGYGLVDAKRQEVPHESTLFEIGSISKVFTGLLLAQLVQEGRISLQEPVYTHLPDCPDFPQDITLQQLVTHTSGFPRVPANLFDTPGYDERNPYAHYTSENLYTYLATYRGALEEAQPGVYSYSNLGAGLLGEILARTLGLSYEQAIVQRICDPLGLSDTRMQLTTEQRGRLATPHTSTGEPTLNWDIPTLAGAGALRSTARDMLTFLAASLGQISTPFQPAFHLHHKVVVELPLAESYPTGVALGWHTGRLAETGKTVYRHTGGTGGYTAFAGFQMESQCGVVVLLNYGYSPETDPSPIGTALIDQLIRYTE